MALEKHRVERKAEEETQCWVSFSRQEVLERSKDWQSNNNLPFCSSFTCSFHIWNHRSSFVGLFFYELQESDTPYITLTWSRSSCYCMWSSSLLRSLSVSVKGSWFLMQGRRGNWNIEPGTCLGAWLCWWYCFWWWSLASPSFIPCGLQIFGGLITSLLRWSRL